jgi:diketogulonate reductase-like aldo/keto reductase
MDDAHLTDPARRRVLQGLAGAATMSVVGAAHGRDDRGRGPLPQGGNLISRPIPVSGETIPAIGMGTWITFNVAPYTAARDRRVEVLRAFFAAGGRLVDSSPMYGLAEAAVGYCREKLGGAPELFSATKVWTPTRVAGVAQMNLSFKLWGLTRFDLMQVHNMVDWETHLATLREWKGQGRVRYLGITTSHGRRHEDMLDVIERVRELDAVQFSYSIADRDAEQLLLPAAAVRGKAVIVNRPFRTGELFERVAGKPVPAWAAEIGCRTWAQYFLKFVISHPAVTCAIPATSSVEHMRENMEALRGPLPDESQRARMIDDFERAVS